jgi:carboxypeptidase Q
MLKHRARRFALAISLFAAIAGLSLLVAVPPQNAQAPKLLADRALGETRMLDDLEELCDRIGGRPAGSRAAERAVEWAAEKFRAAGADSVTLEPFTAPVSWQGMKAEAECLSPAQFPIRLAAAPLSASTPGGRALEAPLVYAGEGTSEDFARLGDKVRGAIVLVSSPEMKTVEDLFGEYARNAPLLDAAQKAGAAALLLQSTRPGGLLYRHPMALDGTIAPIPTAVVSREHAARLARLAEKGDVRVRLTLANKIEGPQELKNVVAEIRGGEKPEEIVVLGAHLDSWELGTGAEDNGVNCALTIDVARGIKQLGLVPRRSIRFVLFNAEELGMWGSAGYVKRHAAELDRTVTMVTFDTGSGRTSGFYLNGREELDGPLKRAVAAARELPSMENSREALDGTDNFDFLLSGVPNLVANQDWAPYLPEYHAESDVFERVDQHQAKVNDAIAAALVWGLANAPQRIAPRQTRAQVEELLRRTRLDEQMKAFGQWASWTSGEQGVSR